MKYNFSKKYNHYGGESDDEEYDTDPMKGNANKQGASVEISSDDDHGQQTDPQESCALSNSNSSQLTRFDIDHDNDQNTETAESSQSNAQKCEDNNKGKASKDIGPKLQFSEPSRMKTYTITKGTILYHGSKSKETFNPYNIKLGSSNLIVFFSPDQELAARTYGSCSNFPVENGYLHEFRVTRDIENIIILSVYDLDNTDTIKKFEDRFCSRNNVYDMILDGIGFFYPSDAKESPETYTSEFALCNPKSYLEYIGTQRCISRQILGESYKFNKA